MEIVIESLVTQKQTALFEALIEKGYFATEDSARLYLKGIGDFIKTLPHRTARRTKDNHYGDYYATYKPNRHTTWYIIFDVDDDRYIVRNMVNNHTADYSKFIASFK